VTIGSNLNVAPTLGYVCVANPCTFGMNTLAPENTAPGGVSSPVNGTVTVWRIRAGGTPSAPVAFRVLRPIGGNLFTGVGTSTSVPPAANATTASPTQLPISIGDQIGINCCNGPDADFYFRNGAGTTNLWNPPGLADGAPGKAPDELVMAGLLLNADVEPISTFTLGAITRNKKKGTATLTAALPNPGELTASGKGVKSAGAAGAVISKTVTAPGAVTLTIKAKGKKKRKLNETGKVKLKVAVTYTPTGGDASTHSLTVKLKKL
jgi:hypothetical protein